MVAGQPAASQLRASVCIPSRNRAELLRLTLESLDRQSVPTDRLQVVIGDDGSTDGTSEMLAKFRSRYELKWTRLDGRGSGAGRNATARMADHEVLIFLDDDQVASPDLVAAHLQAHERNSRTVIVQGTYPLAPGWDHQGASLLREGARLRALGAVDSGPKVAYHLWGGNCSVRRETWISVGGFDENLPRNQDLDFGLRVADLGVPRVVEPRALSHHLHAVSPGQFRRHCYTEGRCHVRIARKRGVPVEVLRGSPVDRPLDRLLKRFWICWPRSADVAGGGFASLLWAADLVRLRPAQELTCRIVRRFHELGGIALEMAAPVTSGGIAAAAELQP